MPTVCVSAELIGFRITMRPMRLQFLVLCLVLGLCKLSLTQPVMEFTGIEPAGRGNEFLHKSMPEAAYVYQDGEMYVYQESAYVRCFQAIFKPIDISRIASERHKDILQDDKGTVIIKPSINWDTQEQEPLWLGVGHPRQQLNVVRRYQQDPASQPMIRSFLVSIDTIADVMNATYLATESFSTKFNLDVNVDRHLPNQFGFKPASAEKIRRNALPGSLVTFVSNYDPRKQYPRSYGKVIDLQFLRESFGIPAEDIPGIDARVDMGRLERYKDMANRLDSLSQSYRRVQQGNSSASVELDYLISGYNAKYGIRETADAMSRNRLGMAEGWAAEARRLQEIMEKYDRIATGSGDQQAEKFPINNYGQLKTIDKDFMFTSGEKTDTRMHELMSSEAENNEQLQKRGRLFEMAEALFQYLSAVAETGSSMGPLRQLSSPENILRTLYADEKVNELKLGFVDAGFDDSLELEKVIGRVAAKIADRVESQAWHEQLVKFCDRFNRNRTSTVIGIGLSSEQATFFREKYPNEGIRLLEARNGRLYEDGEPTSAFLSHETKIAVVYDEASLADLGKLIENSLVLDSTSHAIGAVVFHLDANIGENDLQLRHVLNFAAKLNTAVSKFVLGDTLEFNVIRNCMYKRGTYLGTPRLLEQGHVMHCGRPFDREIITQLQLQSETLVQLQQRREFGIKYFEERDCVPDASYEATENQGKLTNTKLELIKPIESLYRSEIVCQMDPSKDADEASSYIYDRYNTDKQKSSLLVKYDGTTGFFRRVRGDSNVVANEHTRITVVSQRGRPRLFDISGQNGGDLIRKVLRYTLRQATDKVGRISVVAFSTNSLERADLQSIQVFGTEIATVVERYGVSPIVSLRSGYLQVDAEGNRQYGVMLDAAEIEWRYATQLPHAVRFTDKGDVEYFAVSNGRTDWSPERPAAENSTKLCILTEASGDVDIEKDFESKKLRGVISESSGPLDIAKLFPPDVEVASFRAMNPETVANRTFLDLEDRDADAYLLPFRSHDEDGVRAVLLRREAFEWAERLSHATARLVENLPHPHRWIPLIDSAEDVEAGRTRVTVMDAEARETRTVIVEDDEYVRFKATTKRYGTSVNGVHSPGETSIGRTLFSGALDIALFVNEVIQMTRHRSNGTQSVIDESLARSLEISSYIGITEGAFGLVTDVVEIAELAIDYQICRKEIGGIATLSTTTQRFLVFSNIAGKINMGIGAIGSVVSLGFTGEQLAHAHTHADRVQFGVQVAVDSVNVVVAFGSAIAVFAGSAVAGPLGFLATVIGFLASTITSLVLEFARTRDSAKLVGEYFYELDAVYGRHGYEFDNDTRTLSILPHAIVETIDLTEDTITLDSQCIYRTEHGSSGSGKTNYFFWYGDFPRMTNDKNQAINIREGIGYGTKRHSFGKVDVKSVVLPVVPKSYISYGYSRLPFCTTMHDKGFDVLRRLEQDGRFDYDFYIAPGEQIISSISHEYVHTNLTVRIRDGVDNIVIPEIPMIVRNHYTITVETNGMMHRVVLAEGVSLVLRNLGRQICTWYLDVSNMNATSQVPSFEFRQVVFGSTRVSSTENGVLIVIDSAGRLSEVNPFNRTMREPSVARPQNVSDLEFDSYIRRMSRVLHGSQQFVTITDFEIDGTFVGNAFLDLTSNQYMYSDFGQADVSKEFKTRVQMLGILENGVYFMSQEGQRRVIWNADLDNHTIVDMFNLYCGSEDFEVRRLNVYEGALFVVQVICNVSLIYMIRPAEVLLVSIDGSQDDVSRLGQLCLPSLARFLPLRRKRSPDHQRFPARCVYPKTIPLLPLKETTPEGVSRHFWLYMNDTQVNEFEQKGVFCETTSPPSAPGIIRPNMAEECDDLTLRDVRTLPNGTDIYYFHCERSATLFAQVGSSAATEIAVPGGILAIEDFGLSKFVRSRNGSLYVFTESAEVSLAAVIFHSITNYANWTDFIHGMSATTLRESYILVLNMTTEDGTTLPAWYDTVQDQLVMVSPMLRVDDVVYLGPTPNEHLAWLYDTTNGSVILQELLTADEIWNMTLRSGDGTTVWKGGRRPHGQVLSTGLTSVEFMDGAVFCVDGDGVMFAADHFSGITLLGVNNTWLTKNGRNREMRLLELCFRFNATSVITLGREYIGYNRTRHRWYHCGWSSVVQIATQKTVTPSYLGQNERLKCLYFLVDNVITEYGSENGSGPQDSFVDSPGIARRIECQYADVKGKTVLLQTRPSIDITYIPTIDNTVALVVALSNDSAVRVTREVWLHYETIMISSVGNDGYRKGRLVVDAPPPCDYNISVVDGDSIYFDALSDRALVLSGFNYSTGDEYVPDDNQTILEVIMCGSDPVAFFTSPPTMADRQPTPITAGSRLLLIMFVLFPVVGLVGFLALMIYHGRARKASDTSRLSLLTQSSTDLGSEAAEALTQKVRAEWNHIFVNTTAENN